MVAKKPILAVETFSVRIPGEDAARVRAIATAHDWTISKTLAKLVSAALDAKLLK